MKKIVIIAAAGMGSRLGAGLPKCLIEVGGHAIFEYQLKVFEWADEIRMVVGYMADEVIRRVSAVNPHVVFVQNHNFSGTTTRQSNFLGSRGVEGQALFIDGDMLISRTTANLLCQRYKKGVPFVGVACEISEMPVYAGIEDNQVQWFSFDKVSGYEWANVAMLDAKEVEDEPTHFYIQLEKYLPTEAVLIQRLEVDTPEDLRRAEAVIAQQPAEYHFWG